MTTHDDSDEKVGCNSKLICVTLMLECQVEGYKERWVKTHEISKEWVARMTTLVECWNKLDGNVGELSSWVNTKVPTPC